MWVVFPASHSSCYIEFKVDTIQRHVLQNNIDDKNTIRKDIAFHIL